MNINLLSAALLCCAAASAIEQGAELRLWSGDAPGSEGVIAPEVFALNQNSKLARRFDVVHYPSVFAFFPLKETANGMAIIIAPGGGHSWLNMNVDGWPIAEWCNRTGIAAFVLKYRLANAKDSHYQIAKESQADVLRALRLVRGHAHEWSLDPERIGVMGLSAGGEIAARAETQFGGGRVDAPDPIDRISSRPDFAILVYPGFAPGTLAPPKNTPPTFLVCTSEDRRAATSTATFFLELQKQGISAEMHVYATGAHGFGMKPLKIPVATWPDRLKDWLADRKFYR